MPTGEQIVELGRKHVGEHYVLGTLVPKNDPNWKGPFDCAEFASWLVYQISQQLYGCSDDHGDPAKVDAYTGYWDRDAATFGQKIHPWDAAGTPGACLLRIPRDDGAGQHVMGHIVISDGKGGTVEAMSTNDGVVASSVHGRRWDIGVLVPWITYTRGHLQIRPASIPILVLGSTGSMVKEAQLALIKAGYDLGGMPPSLGADGVFGKKTLAAVVEVQKKNGLVPDGEIGPKTRRALGLFGA